MDSANWGANSPSERRLPAKGLNDAIDVVHAAEIAIITMKTQALAVAKIATDFKPDSRHTEWMLEEWLKRSLQGAGKTQAQLARHLGIDPSAVTRMMTGARKISAAEMQKIAPFLGVSAPVAISPPQSGTSDTAPMILPGELMVGDRDLPVYASAEGGPNGAMIISYDPIEWVKRPEPLMTVKNGFAIYVVNDSMVPAFRPGDRALVHPLRQPVAGDDGLFIGETRDGTFYALVKTLIASTERAWRVQQYNPASTFDLPKETWSKAMKIVGKYGR